MVFMRDMAFLGEGISDNLAKTPEGFLICQNVAIAKVGVQQYLGSELGLTGDKAQQVFKVYRLAEDVFDETALRSFEGKPVTDDHPSEEVTPANYATFGKGHLQNIRVEGDHVVADLMVKDAFLLQKIEGRCKRQVSAGYTCVYVPYKDGYRQTQITGNHLAVVERGRAGPKVTIRDSQIKKGVKKPMALTKKQAIATMFAAFARDAEPDQIAEMLPFVTDSEPEKPEPKKAKDNGLNALLAAILAKDEDSDEKKTEDEDEEEKKKADDAAISKALDARFKKLETAMDTLIDRLAGKSKAEDEGLEAWLNDADSDEDEDEKTETTDEDGDEDEGGEKTKADDAAIMSLISELKPAIAKLPKNKQKLFKDAIRPHVAKGKTGVYESIRIGTADKARIESHAEKVSNLGMKIAEANNPHYAKK